MLPLNNNSLMEHKTHNVIDCFPYFNEKEILELRINLLKDYVDKFIIVDSNYTHSGNPKKYTLKRTIDELKLPKEKIEIIELDLSPEKIPPPGDYEFIWNKNAKIASREKLQRDSAVECLKKFDFSDDTIFIVSDCDEIINPKYIETYCNICRNNPQFIFKADLVYLEGRSDYRLYHANNPNVPVDWRYSLFFCNKKHFESLSLTKIRSGLYDHIVRWVYSGNDRIRDVGWHFSWMGSNKNRILKSKSFCHHDQNIDYLTYNNYSNEKMQNFLLEYNFVDGNICPSGNVGIIIKKYPVENLPQIIFDLPRVKQFLLPLN